MVSKIPKIITDHEGVCPGCTSGKHIKGPFPSSITKTSQVLQLIHSYLCGTMLVTSLGGYLYFMNFVDDFSRKIWIFVLKKKGEAFDMFKDFKSLIENQTGNLIKSFKFDNGGEFTSNDFNDLCKDVRIKKETIVSYNPQQNGVAEKKNQTIMEAVKAILHDQKLPKFLWGEVANTIVYVQNRTLH